MKTMIITTSELFTLFHFEILCPFSMCPSCLFIFKNLFIHTSETFLIFPPNHSLNSSLFELDLMSLNPAVGFYKLVLSASHGDKKVNLLGHQDAQVGAEKGSQEWGLL